MHRPRRRALPRYTAVLAACAAAAVVHAAAAAGAPAGAGAGVRDPRALMDVARAGDRLVAVGEWGAVRLSDDAGASWRNAAVPTEETLTAVRFVDATHGHAVGHHGTVLATTDGGKTWTVRSPDPASPEPLLGVAFFDRNHGFAVGAFGALWHTTDGGQRFVARDIGQGDRHLKAIAVHPSGTVVIASEEGAVFCSSDHGATFRLANTGYRGSFWGALALPGAALVYGMRGSAWRSDDDCRSWTALPTATQSGLSAAAVLSDRSIVLAGAEGALLHSADGGRSFAAVPRNDRSAIHAAVALDAHRVLLIGRGAPAVQTFASAKP